jgi:hypothetical protein
MLVLDLRDAEMCWGLRLVGEVAEVAARPLPPPSAARETETETDST